MTQFLKIDIHKAFSIDVGKGSLKNSLTVEYGYTITILKLSIK